MEDWNSEAPSLNITPLVDVMLVLLSILMVTAPTMVYEEMIQLPNGSKEQILRKDKALEIQVTKEKRIYINKEKFDFKSFADRFVLFSSNIPKSTPVIISADERILYKDVMSILKAVKMAGFTQVSLATNG
jgi:biopolymer transport protein ExbD